MTISGIPRSHLTLFRAASEGGEEREREKHEDHNLAEYSSWFYDNLFYFFVWLNVNPTSFARTQSIIQGGSYLPKCLRRRDVWDPCLVCTPPAIDRQADVCGGCSISVTRGAWTLSLDYRVASIDFV